jgi:biotin carboxyl carrier protein
MADDNTIYKVKVNGFIFSFTKAMVEAADVVQLSSVEFSFFKGHRGVNARLVEASSTAKDLKIEIAGEPFFVTIKDELDQVLEQMGFASTNNRSVKEIKAPMPGLVLEIAVSDGQEVKAGDKMLILAAMKMENNIMIHADATIKKVLIVAGQAVEKGQVMVELE